MEGPEGGAALAAAIDDVPATRRIAIAAALGDAQGDEGPAALRAIVQASAPRDVQCAALLALAKRCGPDATAELATALASRESAVKVRDAGPCRRRR